MTTAYHFPFICGMAFSLNQKNTIGIGLTVGLFVSWWWLILDPFLMLSMIDTVPYEVYENFFHFEIFPWQISYMVKFSSCHFLSFGLASNLKPSILLVDTLNFIITDCRHKIIVKYAYLACCYCSQLGIFSVS